MKNSTALILLMISAGLILTFILPYYDKVVALRARSVEYNQILDNLANIQKLRDDLKVKYDNIPEVEVDKLDKVLPEKSDVVSLASNIDSIASRYGISMKSVNTLDSSTQSSEEIMQSAPGGPYNEATITLTLIADYRAFRDFMSDLEQSLRVIDVKSVSFQSSEDDTIYEFKVVIKAYWLKK